MPISSPLAITNRLSLNILLFIIIFLRTSSRTTNRNLIYRPEVQRKLTNLYTWLAASNQRLVPIPVLQIQVDAFKGWAKPEKLKISWKGSTELRRRKRTKQLWKSVSADNTTSISLLIQAEKRRQHGPMMAQPAVGAVFNDRNGETIIEEILPWICFGSGKMLVNN